VSRAHRGAASLAMDARRSPVRKAGASAVPRIDDAAAARAGALGERLGEIEETT